MGLIIPEKKRVGMLDDAADGTSGSGEPQDGRGPFVPEGMELEKARTRGMLLDEATRTEGSEAPVEPPWEYTAPSRPADDKETIRVEPIEAEPIDGELPEEDEESEEPETADEEDSTVDPPDEEFIPDDPFGTGAPRDLWARNKVMGIGGKPFTETITDVIDGIPTACSVVLDFAPGIGDLKGLAEAIRARDLVTDDELGWGSRMLGLVCLSELRSVGKAGKKTRLVKKTGKFVALDDLAKAGGKSDPGDALLKTLAQDADMRASVVKDARRRVMARNRRMGEKGKKGAGKILSDLAERKKGTLRSEVYGEAEDIVVRYDYEIKVTADRYLWEVKTIRWDAVSYKNRWRVRARLSDISKQVKNQRKVAGNTVPHEVWFWTKPTEKWQMDMILEWTTEEDIILTLDKPTILR